MEQGIACAGTSLESRTYRVRNKAFLFVSKAQARMKLGASAAEATRLGFAVGANGWVTVPLDALPATAVSKRWIAESYALLARPVDKPAAKSKSATRRR